MYDEQTAKTKWCPLVRFTPIINSGIIIPGDRKRTEDGKIDDSCLASSCMMWRWVTTLDGDKGYCGLAGVPK